MWPRYRTSFRIEMTAHEWELLRTYGAMPIREAIDFITKETDDKGSSIVADIWRGGYTFSHASATRTVELETVFLSALKGLPLYWQQAANYTGKQTIYIETPEPTPDP